jgi:hypothetical protein
MYQEQLKLFVILAMFKRSCEIKQLLAEHLLEKMSILVNFPGKVYSLYFANFWLVHSFHPSTLFCVHSGVRAGPVKTTRKWEKQNSRSKFIAFQEIPLA